MKDFSRNTTADLGPVPHEDLSQYFDASIEEVRNSLSEMTSEERLVWSLEKFGLGFVLTTSFGIQSAVLLHMLYRIQGGLDVPVIWVDTGYLPAETYRYAEKLSKQLRLNIRAVQSDISPGRMEALHGRLWETSSVDDMEKYLLIRKVRPLEEAFEAYKVLCWASGVRGGQTKHRQTMTVLDVIRGRFSLRPLLEWRQKDVFYYMKENSLPQHPLFEKGYSTIGDWHSSSPDSGEIKGRDTRFGGLKQECGIHLPGVMGDGI